MDADDGVNRRRDGWAALARQYLARREPGLLDKAIQVASSAGEQEIVGILQTIRQEDSHSITQLCLLLFPSLLRAGRNEEALTVELLAMDRGALQVELCHQHPLEEQSDVLAAGLEACEVALNVATELEDVPCVALYRGTQGLGLQWSGDLHAARSRYEQALSLYCRLAEHQPQVYLPYVAGTLVNQGNLLRGLRDPAAARDRYDEALAIFRQLGSHQSRPHLSWAASALHGLGGALKDLREVGAARDRYIEALRIRRELAKADPPAYRGGVGETLNKLGNILRELGDLTTAREALEEALAIHRELAKAESSAHLTDLAGTLDSLGNVLRDLGSLPAARERLEEALGLCRELANKRPSAYLGDLTVTLHNLGNVLRDLGELGAARERYEETLAIRRRLAEAEPQVYLPDVAMTMNNLGLLLHDLRELGAARACCEEAIVVLERCGLWIDSAGTHYNAGLLCEDEGDAEGALRGFEASVERCERGIGQLTERGHRDVFKRKIESAYERLIEHHAREAKNDGRAPTERLVGLLESLRHVETLAGLGEASAGGLEEWREPFNALLGRTGDLFDLFACKRCAFLWVHALRDGVVFVTLEPGSCRVELAKPELLKRFGQLFGEVEHAMAAFRPRKPMLATAVDLARSAVAASIGPAGEAVLGLLPEGVQRLLADDRYQTICLAPCAGTILLPFEMLRLPGGRAGDDGCDDRWLGLRKLMPRLHGLAGLAPLLARQPAGKSALVAGNPLYHGFPHDGKPCEICAGHCPVCRDPGHCGADPLPGARRSAQALAAVLRQRGFTFASHGEPLLDEHATVEAVLAGLHDPRLGLWVHNGHGSRPDEGDSEGVEYLALGGTDRLLPQEVAGRRLPGTVVHHDCCVAGTTRGRGGGRFDGHPTAALLAGASCVLASVHALWDDTAAEFSERLYRKALDPTRPLAMGEALMETRREMAAAYQNNPLVWATTVFWGNPWARLA